MEVVIGDASREVVFEPIGKGEAIKTSGDEQVQIAAPEILVVVPRLVFHLGTEIAAYATHFIRGLLLENMLQLQGRKRIGIEMHPLGEFEQAIDETACVGG
jgi:hypothetical protein